MSTRAVVNVATGRYLRGQARLIDVLDKQDPNQIISIHRGIRGEWPSHEAKPYAFKAYALKWASERNDILLWADASILPIRSLEPIWERIEREGYWMSNNGYSNYTWTADSAYPDLFPEMVDDEQSAKDRFTRHYMAQLMNRGIPHVVATSFGLNMRHPKGRAFLDEYFRLASETTAFCGPWWNKNSPEDGHKLGAAECGPPDVRGHRHDQTAASVIAWRLDFELTEPPEYLAYRGRETDKTILVVDGGF